MKTNILPEIINISDVLKKKSKNFVIHFTDAQWKKAISKAKMYKGKKNFDKFPGDTTEFIKIRGLNGGIITTYNLSKINIVTELKPFVEENSEGEQIIVFKKKNGTPVGSTCKKVCSGGTLSCQGGCSDLRDNCGPILNTNGNIVKCMCLRLATY